MAVYFKGRIFYTYFLCVLKEREAAINPSALPQSPEQRQRQPVAAQRSVFRNGITVLNQYHKDARTYRRNAPPYNFSSFGVKNRNAAALRNAVCLSERSERVQAFQQTDSIFQMKNCKAAKAPLLDKLLSFAKANKFAFISLARSFRVPFHFATLHSESAINEMIFKIIIYQ